MRFSIAFVVLSGLASMAVASALPGPDNAGTLDNCGYPNGNCYENDCHGEEDTLDALADTTAAETLEDAMRTVATEEMDDAPTTISAALAPRRILRPVDGEVPGAGIKLW
ncbi:hypothetical protein LOZ53_006310 [Ophidiomyces ophidiicola]|nr:hypothetical protein LOZ54_006034 [Ophidiomyces ophidiicola]KAI1980302.1 hypothetical protein LOZ55_001452 [Ophidiomyces ophidiicola]KAI1982153.1 hypothetical protein LOZ53_006310 [Ophidiomyces ophidiicola]KAI1987895.1 hypothetical protein LOZ51_005659 [Ophidiomyces ophidiicola]